MVELLTKLYTPEESDPNPRLENEQIISISPGKLTLLIGLMLGVVSSLIFIVFSYWSVQVIGPIPQIQNSSSEPPEGLR